MFLVQRLVVFWCYFLKRRKFENKRPLTDEELAKILEDVAIDLGDVSDNSEDRILNEQLIISVVETA